MRAVVQRVKKAQVEVDGKKEGSIGPGLAVLLGVSKEDTDQDLDFIVRKILKLRVFDDEEGVMNLSVEDVGGDILLVSQFTLYGDARKGNRPSYIMAAKNDQSEPMYEACRDRLAESGLTVETGVFGADMDFSLTNDGPVTILLDSERTF